MNRTCNSVDNFHSSAQKLMEGKTSGNVIKSYNLSCFKTKIKDHLENHFFEIGLPHLTQRAWPGHVIENVYHEILNEGAAKCHNNNATNNLIRASRVYGYTSKPCCFPPGASLSATPTPTPLFFWRICAHATVRWLGRATLVSYLRQRIVIRRITLAWKHHHADSSGATATIYHLQDENDEWDKMNGHAVNKKTKKEKNQRFGYQLSIINPTTT